MPSHTEIWPNEVMINNGFCSRILQVFRDVIWGHIQPFNVPPEVLNHLRVREVKKMYIPPVMDLEPGNLVESLKADSFLGLTLSTAGVSFS